MINQPFGMPPKWFTFREVTTFSWGSGRFSSPSNPSTLEVKYQSFTKDASEQTIDLRNVTGWKTVPNEKGVHIFELETLDVYLSTGRGSVRLYNQKDNPKVKLSQWDNQARQREPMKEVTIPQPKITQIDDFFDAMLAAKLL